MYKTFLTSLKDERKNKKKITLISLLRDIVSSHKFYITGLLIVAIIWAIDLSLRPYLIKLIIDKIHTIPSSQVFNYVTWPILFYILSSLIVELTFRFHNLISLKLRPRIKQKIILVLMSYILGHSHQFFQKQLSGSLANKINDAALGIREIITLGIDRFFSHTLAILIAVYTYSQINGEILSLMSVWMLVFLTISTILMKKSHILAYQSSMVNSKVIGKIVDVLSNIISVRLFASHHYEKKQLLSLTEENVYSEQLLEKFLFKVWLFQGLSFIIIQSVCLWLLMIGIQSGTTTPGDFALLLTLNLQLVECLTNLTKDISIFTEHIGKVVQGLHQITKPHDIQDSPSSYNLQVTKGEICFKNVSFQYEPSKPLFTNKSLVIQSNQKIGLVGYSGSGKSTFANLILRVFDLNSGIITIDGQDISKVTLDSLRNSITITPQDPALFHCSIMDNIRYGRFDATDKDVINAAVKACAHEFISQCPEGYNTIVGERGIRLSAGQRQRIVIARAFLKNTKILILDEATSALDSVIESKIQERLSFLMNKKTTIVIAHRLSTLLQMDRILVFNRGIIEEDGSHQQLLEKNGLYKSFWDTQVGGFIKDDSISSQ